MSWEEIGGCTPTAWEKSALYGSMCAEGCRILLSYRENVYVSLNGYSDSHVFCLEPTVSTLIEFSHNDADLRDPARGHKVRKTHREENKLNSSSSRTAISLSYILGKSNLTAVYH